MWEYIVLGQVPGTQIQVSFESWLIAITFVLLAVLVIAAARGYSGKRPVTALRISRILQAAVRRSTATSYGQWLASRRHIQA